MLEYKAAVQTEYETTSVAFVAVTEHTAPKLRNDNYVVSGNGASRVVKGH